MTEITKTIIEDGESAIAVTVRPLGPFYGVFVDEHEEPLAIGRTPFIARVRAYECLKHKLKDIREAVRQEGRATVLYRRLSRTLRALEGLEKAA